MPSKITDKTINSIAVIRALKLGDFLLFIPAARALRRAFPKARIDYVGLPWNKELVKRFNHYFDGFVEFPGLPGLPERRFEPRKTVEFFLEMQEKNYDLALQVHGNGRYINSFLPLFGAKRLAGYSSSGALWPDGSFMTYRQSEHEIIKHLKLMEFLGVKPDEHDLEFPLYPADLESLQKLSQQQGIEGKPYICIHPGSISGGRWPAERFAEVADAHSALGLEVVITGTPAEYELAAAVESRMRAKPVNLVGRTGLGELAALLAGSQLVVANDTGVSHLATAVGTPSVTVFSTTDPAVWAPLNTRKHRFVEAKTADQDDVLQLSRQLLREERSLV